MNDKTKPPETKPAKIKLLKHFQEQMPYGLFVPDAP